MKRYLLAIAAVVVFLLIFIIFISSIGSKSTTKKSGTQQKTLVDYANTDAVVKLRIKGIINGDDIHREFEIIVGQNSRTMNIIQGYQNTVIKNKDYYNNESAFDEFLHAIDRLGFTKERKGANPQSDSGVCPNGNRYVFTLNQDGKDISSLWSATCPGIGTSAANGQSLVILFQNQIPDYTGLTNGVSLNNTTATL